MENVSNWLTANKLSLNTKKSNVILFNASKKEDNKINIEINGESLKEEQHVKYLGVQIDKNISWGQHIQYTNLKVSRGVGMLAKLRHYVPENTLKNLYNAFIQPHIDYGAVIWGNAPKIHLNKLEVNLKKCVRIMNFDDKCEPSAPIFQKLSILPLKENIKYLQAKFMWKYVHLLHPDSIQEIFDTTNHQNLETSLVKLYLPFKRTTLGQRFISYSGIKLWNQEVPKNVKETPYLNSFLGSYKKYLLENM